MTTGMIKILVRLDSNDWHGMTGEKLWATEVEHGYFRIENNPFYAYGISFADLVEAELGSQDEVLFCRVVLKGGHSNYRIMLRDGSRRAEFDRIWLNLESLGCRYESSKSPEKFFAIDVPPDVDVHYVYSVLSHGEEEGSWYLDEGNFEHARIQ